MQGAQQVSLRSNPQTNATQDWLLSIASDYVPGPGNFQELVERGQREPNWEPSDADWGPSIVAYHSRVDSRRRSNDDFINNLCLWHVLWGNRCHRTVVNHYHYTPDSNAVRAGYWASSVGDPTHIKKKGMSDGDRVVVAVIATIITFVSKLFWDYFQAEEAKLQKPLDKTQELQRKWESITVTQQERELADKLCNVFKAQEAVESTRVRRFSTYKWSSLVLGVGGVALVAGAIANIPEIVVVGSVVVAVALTVFGMTWLISHVKDDKAPAKEAYKDYSQITAHFLDPEIPGGLSEEPPTCEEVELPEAPPAYEEIKLPNSWIGIEVRMARLAARDLQKTETIFNPAEKRTYA